MTNALYYLRTKKTEGLCKKVAFQYGLELDYKDAKKQIFSNDDLQMSVASKYIMVYIFNHEKQELVKELKKMFRES